MNSGSTVCFQERLKEEKKEGRGNGEEGIPASLNLVLPPGTVSETP